MRRGRRAVRFRGAWHRVNTWSTPLRGEGPNIPGRSIAAGPHQKWAQSHTEQGHHQGCPNSQGTGGSERRATLRRGGRLRCYDGRHLRFLGPIRAIPYVDRTSDPVAGQAGIAHRIPPPDRRLALAGATRTPLTTPSITLTLSDCSRLAICCPLLPEHQQDQCLAEGIFAAIQTVPRAPLAARE